MDIFSHGLWAGAVFKFLNLKRKVKDKFEIKWAIFLGVFPDFFSFTIGFLFMFWNRIFYGIEFVHPENLEPMTSMASVFQLTNILYNLSHSVIIFALVFLIIWRICKKPRWILGAWLVHILIDIPTHSYKFYPTPFLWPISGWKFNGFSWGNLYFMIANYTALVLIYVYLTRKEKIKKKFLRKRI